ncbi:immunogenic protein 3 [Wuchereria bancrofti]|uniref:Immunogenic protein 3 n=1 Tax=Wuchereria bancrofti TaxID=6293 RepID=J9E8G7_WUCBA|nr:immunogenic protein 3 [Wuchereria bancrofti]VDM13478.1 unnamed protein product [Wuchereria bancrofti]
MILSLVFCISLLSFSIIQTTIGCDIIMRVKSLTHTPFHAQIIAPDGNSSEKKLLKKNERLTFQEKADKCSLGPFQIKTISDKKEESVKVTLNGIGVVNYEVGDDLIPKQIFRQGAECKGQCAPLGAVIQPHKTTTAVKM